MSEKYKIINETEYSDIVYRNFPVIPLKSRITYDNQNDKIIVQIKLCNVSSEIVDTVYLSLSLYDVSGQLLQTVDEHIISMLEAANGQSFGDKQPFYADDTRISSAVILIKKVVFTSGKIWEITESCTNEPAEPKKEIDFTGNISSQFFKEAHLHGIKTECKFEEYKNYWRCSCGMLNDIGETTCKMCSSEVENLRKCFDTEYISIRYEEDETARKEDIYNNAVQLSSSMDIGELEQCITELKGITGWKDADKIAADVRDKRDKIAAEQIVAEKKATKKRNIKIVIFAGSTVAVIALIYLAVTTFIPAAEYNHAISLCESGKYDKAVIALEKIENNNYTDEQLEEIQYLKAVSLFEIGKKKEAFVIFKKLKNYKDSIKYRKDYIRDDVWKALLKYFSSSKTYTGTGDWGWPAESKYELTIKTASDKKSLDIGYHSREIYDTWYDEIIKSWNFSPENKETDVYKEENNYVGSEILRELFNTTDTKETTKESVLKVIYDDGMSEAMEDALDSTGLDITLKDLLLMYD